MEQEGENSADSIQVVHKGRHNVSGAEEEKGNAEVNQEHMHTRDHFLAAIPREE